MSNGNQENSHDGEDDLLRRLRTWSSTYETVTGDSRERIRSKVTLIVVKVYSAAVILLMLAGIYLVYFCSKDLSAITTLGDTLQKLFLPILTLVLGFYYGTKEDTD